MTTKTQIIALLEKGSHSAKQIASRLSLSESRVRELLADLVNVGTISKDDTTRPATFGLVLEADETIEALPISVNPFAALAPKEVAAAVNEGLEQGQAAIEEPVLLQDIIDAMPKAKKAPINPQPEIDKKVAAVEKAGGALTYAARKWTISKGEFVLVLTSREFSLYRGDAILELLPL